MTAAKKHDDRPEDETPAHGTSPGFSIVQTKGGEAGVKGVVTSKQALPWLLTVLSVGGAGGGFAALRSAAQPVPAPAAVEVHVDPATEKRILTLEALLDAHIKSEGEWREEIRKGFHSLGERLDRAIENKKNGGG